MIYPGGFGLQFFHVRDAEYQRESIRVYNDWINEFCSAAPDRLLGSALLPMRGPVEWAVEEAERIAKMKGIRTVLIPAEVERSYAHADYNRMWDALQDIGLPVATHSGTGTGEAIFAKMERLGTGLGVTDNKVLQPMRAMADLIWGCRTATLSEVALCDSRRRRRLGGLAARLHGPLVERSPPLDGAEA